MPQKRRSKDAPLEAALFSPAAERNADPIWQVLAGYLAKFPHPYVLEIASGSGQHAAAFCSRHENLRWQPTDISPAALASIAARREALPEDVKARLREPLALDVAGFETSAGLEAAGGYSHILAVNMIHIAPFACCEGLFALASKLLASAGQLVTYGPYVIDGVETAPSNLAFDRQLKVQSPDYGIRKLREVSDCAARYDFSLLANHPMPANNNLLVWTRS